MELFYNVFIILLMLSNLLVFVKNELVTQGNRCPPHGDALALVHMVSLDVCLKHCHIRNHCKLLCYRIGTNICEIHGSNENMIQCGRCVSVRHDDISVLTEPSQPSCKCSDGETCSTLDGTCAHKECGELSFPLGEMYGNSAFVGARRILKCYTPGVNIYITTTCSETGTWQNVPECEDICQSIIGPITLLGSSRILLCSHLAQQNDAHLRCRAMGGMLLKLDTPTKAEATRDVIFNNPELTGIDYWVNGYSPQASDHSQWTFSDGTSVPMNDPQIWNTPQNAPNDGHTPACVRMREAAGYLIDDRSCNIEYGFICQL